MIADTDIIRQYGAQNAGKIAAALGKGPTAAAPSGIVAAAPVDAAPDLVLTPPPDEKVRRRNAKIEWQEQCAYFARINSRLDPAALAQGLFVALPEWPGADMIYAVTNSNVAGKAIGGQLKEAGLRRGYPDINIDVPRLVQDPSSHWYHGARIELKTAQGTPSDVEAHQREWHERINERGYLCVVCFGWREALRFTAHYLGWGAGGTHG